MRYLYVVIGILVLAIAFYVYSAIKYNKKFKRLKDDEAAKIEQYALEKNEGLLRSIEIAKLDLSNLQSQITFNSSILNLRKDEITRLAEEEKERQISKVNEEVQQWAESAQEAANWVYENAVKANNNAIEKLNQELENLVSTVNDYKEKRDAINQEILRSRAISEQQDFYRIQIEETSKHDIEVINSVRSQIYKFEVLNKLLYDNYISKPTKEMIKRVLEGKNPSGIYKVTNIKTQEIYIGKSTTIAERWTNHVKSACGLSGVADSQFQRALKQYGIDEFTWELLEVVPKEKLTEREKYWINFYDTTHYGYNMRVG